MAKTENPLVYFNSPDLKSTDLKNVHTNKWYNTLLRSSHISAGKKRLCSFVKIFVKTLAAGQSLTNDSVENMIMLVCLAKSNTDFS